MKKSLALFIQLVLACFISRGQEYNSFQYLQINDLPSIDNYKTVEDYQGFIWVCSESGLVKYNFSNSKKFTIKDGIPTNDIWDVFPDTKNRIWLLYRGKGIRYIKNDVVYNIKAAEKLNELFVIGEKNDTVYFRSFDNKNNSTKRIYYFSPNYHFGLVNLKTDEVLEFENKIQNIKVIRTNSNKLFAKSQFGIHQIPFIPYSISSVFIKNDQLIYVKAYNKYDTICFFDKGRLIEKNSKSFFNAEVKRIYISNNHPNEAIVETKSELRYYSDILLKKRDFEIEKILSGFYKKHGFSFHVLKDSQNNIWITLHRGGVYFIPYKFWYLRSYNLPVVKRELENNLNSLSFSKSKLFLTNRDHQLIQFDLMGNKSKKIVEFNSLRDYSIRNDLLVGISEFSGLLIYDIASKKTTILPEIIRSYTFDFLNDDEILLGDGQIYNIKKNTFSLDRIFFTKEKIKRLKIVDRNVFCIGSDFIKIINLDSKKVKHAYKFNNPISIQNVGNAVWVNIDGNGVLQFDKNGKLKKHWLKQTSISAISGFKDYLLFASNDIVFVLKKSNGSHYLANIYESDLNKLQRQIQGINVENNILYFATNNGFFSIPINSILYRTNNKFKNYFSAAFINGKKTQLKRHYSLEYNFGQIELNFQSVSYSGFNSCSYEFKLTGDENWTRKSKNGVLTLSNLAPGSYKLEAQAFLGYSKSNKSILFFTVDTPFWKSGWFYLILFFILILVIYLIVIKIVSIRSEYFKRKNKLLELELKALKSQLNPHFIFNAMNTLQSFIYTKSEMELNKYLVSFSKLIRSVLDNSKTDYIQIKDEIQFLKDYIDIMSVKFESGINYEFKVLSQNNIDQKYIRNMMIQPYIENAIIHGLTTKEGEKKIEIHFNHIVNYLFVEIIDNGIGREKSGELNKKNNYHHRSWASTILKEKTEVINDLYKEDIQCTIIDLPTGTKVELKIKLLDELDDDSIL